MNISQLSSLVKLFESNPAQLKTLLKLSTVDVLKDLGSDKYTISLDGKKMTAQSQTKLQTSQTYQAEMTLSQDKTPTLNKLVKIPHLLKMLPNSKLHFTPETLKELLSEKSPHESLKSKLLEHLPNASSKEEFQALSTMLLSLSHNTFTIPLYFQNYFSLLQLKKRYNKEKKRAQLDFYATLELLGPISGVVLLEEGSVFVMIHVAYEKTQEFLKKSSKEFSYPIEIELHKSIEPLFDTKINSLLDIKI